MKKDTTNDIRHLQEMENDKNIEEYDSYDGFVGELDDTDIEILKTRNKNEDYGEKSVGIVSHNLWGDWGRDKLKKKIRKDTDEIICVGAEENEDIIIDQEVKESIKDIEKAQSSNYYNGVLNTELKKNNLYKKYHIIYFNGYYYGYDLKNKTVLSLLTLIDKLPKESKENIYIKSLYKMNK